MSGLSGLNGLSGLTGSSLSGHLSLRAAPVPGTGRTVIARQSFRSPFHLGKAYWDEREAGTGALIVHVVNATAGMLDGDALETDVEVASGAALLLTAPAASRAYTAREGGAGAVSRQRYAVAAGAWLEVMPEPLVPHRAARFRQETSLDVAPGGSLCYAEILAPGRSARGEDWAWTELQIDLSLRVGATLAYRERTRQTGEELAALARLAGTAKPWFATLLLVSGALKEGAWREDLHALQDDLPGLRLGFSRLPGEGAWAGRLIADGPVALREALARVRARLRQILPRLAADPRKV